MTRGGGRSGFTLLEVVVSLSLFGAFLLILAQLTLEMRGYEKRLPVSLMTHPEVAAVMARLRRDVMDSTAPYYPASYENYTQSSTTLILYTLQPNGYAQTVVWDFSKKGEATRRAYSVGALTSEWLARGVPQFTVGDFPVDDHPDSVRIRAVDSKGLLAIDQILQPRAHE